MNPRARVGKALSPELTRWRWGMSFESVASDVVRVTEAFGGGIMVVGGLIAFARYGLQVVSHQVTRSGS